MSSEISKIQIPKAICSFASVVSDTYYTPSLYYGNMAQHLPVFEMKSYIPTKKTVSLARFQGLHSSFV